MKTSLVLTLPVLLFSTAVVACSDAEQEGVATQTDEILAADKPAAVESEAPEASAPLESTGPPVADAELAAFRTDLLDLAFEAASAFPLKPHLKNRSAAQDRVVATSFALELPRRAVRYAEGIENWRRGAAFADFAYYAAERGDLRELDQYLNLAREVVRETVAADDQAWRSDRIRAKIARTHILIGQDREAAAITIGLEESESGIVYEENVQQLTEEQFDAEYEGIVAAIDDGAMETVSASLSVCLALIDRFYESEERREKVTELLPRAWPNIPAQLQLENVLTLARTALRHDDPQSAAEYVSQAEEITSTWKWLPESEVPFLASIANLKVEAGAVEEARALADRARAVFEKDFQLVADVFRAETLVPLAETYAALGDLETARAIYLRAMHEGTLNPNARPRCDALVLVCCSLAEAGVEPDAELWAKLRETRAGLTRPW